jgi:hypothetical protein
MYMLVLITESNDTCQVTFSMQQNSRKIKLYVFKIAI